MENDGLEKREEKIMLILSYSKKSNKFTTQNEFEWAMGIKNQALISCPCSKYWL